MADSLKDNWKKTGVGLGHAFRDLGKSIIRSGSYAVNKADAWANEDEESVPQQPQAPAQAMPPRQLITPSDANYNEVPAQNYAAQTAQQPTQAPQNYAQNFAQTPDAAGEENK